MSKSIDSPHRYAHSNPSGATTSPDRDDPFPQSLAEDRRDRTERDEEDYYIPPRKNCCTWKVAAAFLALVAGALVVGWQILPAEEIAAMYIPKFDEPEIAYAGPEAGAPRNSEDDGGGADVYAPSDGRDPGDDEGEADEGEADEGAVVPSFVVPSFMQCPEGDELCCNGNAVNCMLRVDQMMFGLVHNSMSSEEGDFTFGYNHRYELEKALVAGYRGLNLDLCNCDNGLQFCHNVCNLGERYPKEVFGNVLGFLDDYPSEVVVLIFQASEMGPIVWDDLYAEMENVDGFVDTIYVHTYGNEWPTMGDLVRRNKRVIIFYFNGGTCTDGACPLGFNDFYAYAAETQYQSETLEDLEDGEYSCEITRQPGQNERPADFFVVNNFVTPPDEEASAVANSRQFLADRLTACANLNRRRPNFVYLDFWSVGVTAQLVQFANEQSAERLGR